MLYIPQPFKKEINQKIENMIGKLDSNLFENIQHDQVICDSCNMNPIKGIRIKCDECIDFDLCFKCYQKMINEKKKIQNHSYTHNMLCYVSEQKIKFKTDDIQLLDQSLGEGCFGKVQKAKLIPYDTIVACKTLEVNEETKQDRNYKTFLNEIKAYSEIRSKYITRYYGYIRKNLDNKISYLLLTEFIEGGTLENFIKKQSASMRRKISIILDILKGVKRIHRKNFIHKDLKPDNILITKFQTAKITDMGIAIHQVGLQENYTIAPRLYAAPELLFSSYKTEFSNSVDVFSLGLLINFIFSGMEHKRSLLTIKLAENQYFVNTIKKCINNDPNKRPSIQDLLTLFQKCDDDFWKSLQIKKRIYIQLPDGQKNEIFYEFYKKWSQNKDI